MRPLQRVVLFFLFFQTVLMPVRAHAIQLHWSTGVDTLRLSVASRGVLVVKADVGETILPTEWMLFWRGDSMNVAVLPQDSLVACSGDTANVKRLDGPTVRSDSLANVSTAQVCRGGNASPTLARYAMDLLPNVRGKFKLVVFDSSNPISVVESNEVLLNQSILEAYTHILSLSASTAPRYLGAPVTFKAVVAPLPLTATDVTFFDGTVALGTATATNGIAVFTTAALALGTHSVTAATDTTLSAPVACTVVPRLPASIALGSYPNPSRDHQMVLLTATTSPSNATGTVTFRDSLATLGVVPIAGGIATLSLNTLAVGTRSLTASYDGDLTYAPASTALLSHVVQPLVPTSTVATALPSPATVGRTFRLRATVSPSNSTGSVEFKDGAATLGIVVLSSGTAFLSANTYCSGSHSATAYYSGDSTHYASSSAVQWTSNPAPTYVTTVSSLSNAPYTQSVRFTATIHDSGASVCSHTGTVQFQIDGASIGAPVPVSADTASATTSSLLPGLHGVIAIYSGNVDYLGSSGAALQQSIGGPEPSIVNVRDVSGDQGGWVKVSFNASPLDLPPYSGIDYYYVLRSVPAFSPTVAMRTHAAPPGREAAEASLKPGTIVDVADPDTTRFWEYVGSLPAFHTPKYSYLAHTTTDSLPGVLRYTLFMVMAHGTPLGQSWFSKPDSGYSVDNLPPLAPHSPLAQAAPGGMNVSWQPNSEADLWEYRVYRGADSSFVPSPANLVGHTALTHLFDPAGSPGARYKLTAVDIHGNAGSYSLVTAVADVGGESTLHFALAALSPNPVRGSRLSADIVLTRPAGARLELLDVAGRRIASKELGSLTAGRHVVVLDLSAEVTPGLYLVRLSQGAESRIRRVAVLK